MTVVNSYIRSVIYKDLSSLHAYPEVSLLNEIGGRKEEIKRLFRELSNQRPFFLLPSLEEIIFLAEEISIEKLQTEYVRLFDYHPLCSTHETFYADHDSRDPAQNLSAIIECYNEFNLDLAASFQEPPDCLMHELEFMHFLTHMEGEVWMNDKEKSRRYIKAEKMFLGKHLVLWISEFRNCVKSNSTLSFFQKLADLTKIFITLDYDYICTLDPIERP